MKIREYKSKCLETIGNKCFICETAENLCFHRINGESHQNPKMKAYYRFILEHKRQFVTLCKNHHRMVHVLNKHPELRRNLEITLGFVEQIGATYILTAQQISKSKRGSEIAPFASKLDIPLRL